MFSWRKKNASRAELPQLMLFDSDMQPLYAGPLNEFDFPESVILACSEEFFHDPAPCEIHRRAVQQRLYGEMLALLPFGQTMAISAVPQCIGLYCQQFHPAYIRLDQSATR